MPKSIDIKVGDFVVLNGKYPNLNDSFVTGPKKVECIADGPSYAGGHFVYCEELFEKTDTCFVADGRFFKHGFYINGLKKYENEKV